MKCQRREELQEMLALGHWPAAATDDLRLHVAGCRACRELAMVTTALQGAREASVRSVRLEPAGLIWWRAQLRKRRVAMETVDRPIRRAQVFAVAVCLCVGMVLVGWQMYRGAGVAMRWPSISALSASVGLVPAIAGAALLLMMFGVAVYLSVERE